MTAVFCQAPVQAEPVIDAPLLDQSHAQRAYRIIELWLSDSLEVPTQINPIRVTGLIGVRVVLRKDGVLVGQGESYREDLQAVFDEVGPSIDMVPLLLSATDQAKAGVLESLADARLRTVLEGRSVPDAGELRVKDVSAGLIVELELSYGLETISLHSDADGQALYARFAPCYHGLVFTDPGLGTRAWVWPSEMVARNIAAPSQMVLGLKRLGYERSAVAELARPGGVGLARCKTFHVVRPRFGDHPAMLVRGAIDLPRYAVGQRELIGMSDRLMVHLNNRITSTGEVRGTYHPTSGRYDPPTATDEQAALLCYAMMHHRRYLAVTRPEDTALSRSTLALDVIADRVQLSGEAAPTRVLGLVLLAMLEAPGGEADPAVRDLFGRMLLARVTQAEESNPDGAKQSRMGDGDAALSAAVLATLFERTRRPEVGQAVREVMDRLWTEPDAAPNLSALPWLAMAHERAGKLLAEADESGEYQKELDRRGRVMAGVIERLCRRQVIETPTLGPDDVLGGFVLTAGPAGAPPNPDWHNALPLMFTSMALRDAQVSADRDRLGWILSAGFAARFVGQLMIDDAGCYYVRDRVAARGGVRMAPWDNRLALAPSAMSLLALTELQTTLLSFDAGKANAVTGAAPREDQVESD